MNGKINKIRKTAAFTLVELLIATLLSGIVVSAALKIYLVQQKHLVVQDQISDMQQSVRSSADELSAKIRMAGYNLPTGVTPIIASNSNPDSITIVYDDGSLVNVQLTAAMALPAADLNCAGFDLTVLNDGDWLYIFDPTALSGEFFQTSSIIKATSVIQHNSMALSKAYPVGSRVSRLVMIKYYVDAATDAAHPRLMSKFMNQAAQIYADNISDLQFQYVLSSGVTVNTPPIATMVREVIIGISSRTDKSDSEFATNYRTRNLQTRVKVRNLGIH
jgi:hypothetical protein